MPRQYKTVGIDHRDPNLWIASYNKANAKFGKSLFKSAVDGHRKSTAAEFAAAATTAAKAKATVASNDDDDDATDEDEDAFEIDSSDSEVDLKAALVRGSDFGEGGLANRVVACYQNSVLQPIFHTVLRDMLLQSTVKSTPEVSHSGHGLMYQRTEPRRRNLYRTLEPERLQPGQRASRVSSRRSAAADATAEQQGRKMERYYDPLIKDIIENRRGPCMTHKLAEVFKRMVQRRNARSLRSTEGGKLLEFREELVNAVAQVYEKYPSFDLGLMRETTPKDAEKWLPVQSDRQQDASEFLQLLFNRLAAESLSDFPAERAFDGMNGGGKFKGVEGTQGVPGLIERAKESTFGPGIRLFRGSSSVIGPKSVYAKHFLFRLRDAFWTELVGVVSALEPVPRGRDSESVKVVPEFPIGVKLQNFRLPSDLVIGPGVGNPVRRVAFSEWGASSTWLAAALQQAGPGVAGSMRNPHGSFARAMGEALAAAIRSQPAGFSETSLLLLLTGSEFLDAAPAQRRGGGGGGGGSFYPFAWKNDSKGRLMAALRTQPTVLVDLKAMAAAIVRDGLLALNGAIKLEDLLAGAYGGLHVGDTEILEGDNKWAVSQGCKVRAAKYTQLGRCGEVLIFQLARFEQEMTAAGPGRTRKINTRVDFPLEGLSVARFQRDPPETVRRSTFAGGYGSASGVARVRDQADWVYDLVGVTCHQGSLNGGHYTAFVKRDPLDNDSWWFKNDEHAQKVTVCKGVRPGADQSAAAGETWWFARGNDEGAHSHQPRQVWSVTKQCWEDQTDDAPIEQLSGAYLLYYQRRR
jgi:hypothetical protein